MGILQKPLAKTHIMNFLEIKQYLSDKPALRKVLGPLISARQNIISKRLRLKKEIQDELIQNLYHLLSDDPILQIEEFRGEFAIDVRSSLFRRLVATHQYEPELADIFTQWIDQDRDVIDIGANIGFFTVLGAQLINADRVVLAIEPTSAAFNRLKRNIGLNQVGSKTILFKGAISAQNSTLKIKTISGQEEFSTAGVFDHPSIRGLSYEEESVQTRTLDDLIESYDVDPGFIKMDVEGFEYSVIRGAEKVLSRSRPVILSELNDPLLTQNGASATKVLTTISEFEYVIFNASNGKPISNNQTHGVAEILCVPIELSKHER